MASSKSGIQYEHELANGVYRRTGHRLLPQRDGFSGNGAVPSADLQIEDGRMIHAFEVKKTSQSSKTFEYKPNSDDPGDIDELLQFQAECPRTVCAYLGVRFENRQLVIAKIHRSETLLEDIVATCPVDAKATRADNVSIRKPQTENQALTDEIGWPSASVGDDVGYLLETIGYNGPTRQPA